MCAHHVSNVRNMLLLSQAIPPESTWILCNKAHLKERRKKYYIYLLTLACKPNSFMCFNGQWLANGKKNVCEQQEEKPAPPTMMIKLCVYMACVCVSLQRKNLYTRVKWKTFFYWAICCTLWLNNITRLGKASVQYPAKKTLFIGQFLILFCCVCLLLFFCSFV